MKRNLLCLLLLVAAIPNLYAQNKRKLEVDDMFRLKEVSGVSISPDGKSVAFELSGVDKEKDESYTNIYTVPASGGSLVQVTFSGDDESPKWSPDGKYLSFLSSRAGESQVYLLPLSGGEAVALTKVTQGVDDYEWSPDGKKLLLVITDPDPNAGKEGAPPPHVITRHFFKFDGVGYLKELYRHLYVLDVETRKTKQLTFGPYDDAHHRQSDTDFPNPARWSPDGKQILFVSNRTKIPDLNTNTDLFVVPAEGGEPRKLTTNEGADQMPYWSPDGKSIVYVTSLEPQYLWFDQLEIAVIPAAGGEPVVLTKNLDRNTWEPRFGSNGRIYFLLEDLGTQRLISVAPDGSDQREETEEKIVYDYDIDRDGVVAVTSVHPDSPGDIYLGKNGKSTQLTRINEEVMNGIALGKMERVRLKSTDGTPIEGFVTKPPDFQAGKKYPAILWIHGGPNAQETEEFYFTGQYYASKGYVVIGIDYRGSTGYGKDFQRSIYRGWGTHELPDLMAGVDHVIAQGYVDPERIGVGGHSYGAILTNYLITYTKRFKAAITDAGESNYLMNYGVDQYLLDWEAEMGKPWENVQRYIDMSPYFKLKNVTTPTLVMCGEKDWNVPLINAEQLYLSLKMLGVDTMLVVYPGEPHSLRRPSYRRDRTLRYTAWFDHFLQGAPSKIPKQ